MALEAVKRNFCHPGDEGMVDRIFTGEIKRLGNLKNLLIRVSFPVPKRSVCPEAHASNCFQLFEMSMFARYSMEPFRAVTWTDGFFRVT